MKIKLDLNKSLFAEYNENLYEVCSIDLINKKIELFSCEECTDNFSVDICDVRFYQLKYFDINNKEISTNKLKNFKRENIKTFKALI